MAKKKAGKIARQKSLPGMQDRAIKALDNAAQDYAEIRDQRQALTTQEVELKGKVLDLMHKFEKKEYKHGNVSIVIVPEGEKVKVRIKAEESPDAAVITDDDVNGSEPTVEDEEEETEG